MRSQIVFGVCTFFSIAQIFASNSNKVIECVFIGNDMESVELVCENVKLRNSSACGSLLLHNEPNSSIQFKKMVTILKVGDCKSDTFNNESIKNFRNFVNLRVLDISSSGCENFAYRINVRALEKLNASHNNVRWILSKDLKPMRNLSEADFSFNKIREIGTFIPNKLTFINLAQNLLWHVNKTTFFYLKELRVLDLSYNRIQSIDVFAFERNKNLEILKLQFNRLQRFNYGQDIPKHSQFARLEVDTVYHQSKLRELDISRNDLRHVNLSFFQNDNNLVRLNLQSNNLTDSEMDKVSRIRFSRLGAIGIANNWLSCAYLTKLIGQWNKTQFIGNASQQKGAEGGCYLRSQNETELTFDSSIWTKTKTEKEIQTEIEMETETETETENAIEIESRSEIEMEMASETATEAVVESQIGITTEVKAEAKSVTKTPTQIEIDIRTERTETSPETKTVVELGIENETEKKPKGLEPAPMSECNNPRGNFTLCSISISALATVLTITFIWIIYRKMQKKNTKPSRCSQDATDSFEFYNTQIKPDKDFY